MGGRALRIPAAAKESVSISVVLQNSERLHVSPLSVLMRLRQVKGNGEVSPTDGERSPVTFAQRRTRIVIVPSVAFFAGPTCARNYWTLPDLQDRHIRSCQPHR